jgi:hypothetical protein
MSFILREIGKKDMPPLALTWNGPIAWLGPLLSSRNASIYKKVSARKDATLAPSCFFVLDHSPCPNFGRHDQSMKHRDKQKQS